VDEAAVLKVDLHIHTSDDPIDSIPYDSFTLIDRASELGYSAVAITLHDRQLPIRELAEYGRDHGVVVIRGIERTIDGKHVLLLNFPPAAEQVRTFDEVARLKADTNGLVVAPHPFYPAPCCLRGHLDRYADVFDAIEVSAFYTRAVDFNRRGVEWAKKHGKPLVGNGDVHRLWQLGTTYSFVDAAPDADAICEAIRAGSVEVRTAPLSTFHAASLFASLFVSELWNRPSQAHGSLDLKREAG